MERRNWRRGKAELEERGNFLGGSRSVNYCTSGSTA